MALQYVRNFSSAAGGGIQVDYRIDSNELIAQNTASQIWARCSNLARACYRLRSIEPVSYTHLTLPTTPYV